MKTNLLWTWSNGLRGATIYAGGDFLATLILNEISLTRSAGVALLGGSVYALEIPAYFQWIDKKSRQFSSQKTTTVLRTALALLYFNPIWIARHIFFLNIFSGVSFQFSTKLILTASKSFIFNIPLSLLANYLIQNKVILHWRFTASALFSALMAIYYAFSRTLF